jgi:hypothetical protein
MRMRLEFARADWETVRGLVQRAEDAVEANLATPCPFNVGLHLMAAVGVLRGGNEAEASRLLAKAESIGMVGYGRITAAWRLSLALVRGDRAEVRRQVDSIDQRWLTSGAWNLWCTFLDALALLGDRDRIEAEAPQWVGRDAYVAPFAVRALGVVRDDRALLADAVDRFEAMGLAWHAQETRRLLEPS